MPSTRVPSPPTFQSAFPTASRRESVAVPSAKALKITTVATRAKADSTCRNRSQSYTRREPYPSARRQTRPAASGGRYSTVQVSPERNSESSSSVPTPSRAASSSLVVPSP